MRYEKCSTGLVVSASGATFLGRGSLVPPRVREQLILRTCARCNAEYEWGVHVTAFAAAVGLDDAAVRATLEPTTDDDVLALADALHDSATVSDELWARLAARFSENELLEMIAIVGFYHLISFTVNAVRVEPESWAARFSDRGSHAS